jgi:hypothetical protein
VDGIDKVFQHFTALVDGLKRAQYRVLDYRHSGFDRDYVEFSAAISETEALLLQFVNSAFEKAASTPSALKLLRQLKAIMKRASLRDDLEGKFLLIFHKYETDLEAVQAEYEAGRTAPPIGRNMTPVSGAIAWSRHLLGRIEGPMSEFNQNSQLMGTREAKKIVKMYNRVARTLIEFEYLWTEAWTRFAGPPPLRRDALAHAPRRRRRARARDARALPAAAAQGLPRAARVLAAAVRGGGQARAAAAARAAPAPPRRARAPAAARPLDADVDVDEH